jgi:hypothetical protein
VRAAVAERDFDIEQERGGAPGARGGVALMHFTAAISGGWISEASEVATGLFASKMIVNVEIMDALAPELPPPSS